MDLACSIAGGLLMFVLALWLLSMVWAFVSEWLAMGQRSREYDAYREREDSEASRLSARAPVSSPQERWWCSTCEVRVPSSESRCSKCGRTPKWR